MGLSNIIRALNNKSVEQNEQKLFSQNRGAWLSYVGGLKKMGLLLGDAPVSAVRLARRVIESADFGGKLYLIGKGDGLKGQLPFFASTGEFQFKDGAASCAMELVANPPAGLPLILSRDNSHLDTKDIPCDYLVQISPYGSSLPSYVQCTAGEDKQRVTYVFDDMLWSRPYRILPLYRDAKELKSLSAPVSEYWKAHYAQAHDCEKLVSLCQNALVLPVEKGSESSLLLLGLAAMCMKPEKQAVVIADFSGACCDVLRMFAQQPVEKWADKLSEQFPASVRENFMRGLVTPLCSMRAQLADRLERIHFPKSLSETTPEPGHVYVCAVKGAPEDYRDAVYAQAVLPAFCADPETTCITMCAGSPFLCAEPNAYTARHGAAAAQRLLALAKPLENDISLYLNAADLKLVSEVSELAGMFKETASNADTETKSYFKRCKDFAQQEQNRRLEQGAALAHAFGMYSNMRAALLWEGGQQELEQLYKKLVSSLENGQLVLSKAMPNSRAAQFFDSLSEAGALRIAVEEKNITLDREQTEGKSDKKEEPGEIIGVSIADAKVSIGGVELTIKIGFNNYEGPVNMTVNARTAELLTLDGLPWLRFSDAGFSFTLSEDSRPVCCRVEGTVKDTGLRLFMSTGADGSRSMGGSFYEPITSMDAFYALAGGVEFVKSLPEELQTLGGIGLKSMTLTIDGEGSVAQMDFLLTTKEKWTLWERDGNPLITLVPQMGLSITCPMELQSRQITACVQGDCAFGDAGSLRLTASYPPFMLAMKLTSDLNIGELLRMFDVDAPFEADITTLDIFAKPSVKLYQLRAVVEGDWSVCEQFSVNGLGLELISSGDSLSVAFSGLMSICSVQAGVYVRHSSEKGWALLAKVDVGGKLTMADLVSAYGGGTAMLTDMSENNPLLANVTASYATKGGDWSVTAAVTDWEISFLNITIDAKATVGSASDAMRCSLDAEVCWNNIDIAVGYSYIKGENNFYFSWGKFSGKVENSIGTLTVSDFSLGDIVSEMVGWATGSPFGLEAPWDALNSIKLEKFILTYNFDSGEVSVQVDIKLDLGFADVTGVKLIYGAPKGSTKKQVQVTLLGSFPWNTGENALGGPNELGPWDAATPGSSPSPDGKGNAYFDLRLLALGQRVKLFDEPPLSAEQALKVLESCDPEKIPDYSASVGWIVGAHFGLLKDSSGKEYFLNAELIFCDPSLFALHITLDGSAAKLFKGLSFTILYSKISDTVGVYKACVVLPDRMRYFDIGAYSLTMPCFGLEIYTNGDFKVDIGFPQKGDFSCSFAISGQFGPVPFTGAAGIYFGKLSSVTAASSGIYLPQTDLGLFNPVIAFGIGLQIGVGKSLNAGVLKAGFSLTLVAILEGVFAEFNPYCGETTEGYYAVSGTAGIHGAIYGSIDFVIITASVNLAIGMDVSFAIAAYRASRFTISAYLEASATLTINLGLFKIKLSFSFSLHVQESFTVGSDTLAPWDKARLTDGEYEPKVLTPDFSHLLPDGIRCLPVQLSLALTASADDLDGTKHKISAVAMMTLSPDSFCTLAKTVACWAVAAACDEAMDEKTLCGKKISESLLADLDLTLANTAAVSWNDVERLLGEFFIIEAQGKELMAQNGEAQGVVFPLPPELYLTLKEGETVKLEYKLDEYSHVSPEALVEMRKEFDRLAVAVENESQKLRGRRLQNAPALSMAKWLMTDYFTLLARQTVKYLLTEVKKGERTFGELLEALSAGRVWENIAGMVSRYQLHGLRIPTDGITRGDGSAFAPEMGIHALCGAQLDVNAESSVGFSSNVECGWLSIPQDYCVAVDAGLAELLESRIKRGFFPALQLVPNAPERIPLSLSFSKPFPLDAQTAWNVPEGMPRDCGSFALKLFSVSQEDGRLSASQPESLDYAALVEFSVKKTDFPNVFIITGAHQQHTALLAEAVRQQLPVSKCRLEGASCELLSVVQMDLSTETHPPVSNEQRPWQQFLKTLWKAFVTNNGGYALVARPDKPFPEELFNEKGEGSFTLVIVYEAGKVALESPAVNAVLSSEPVGDNMVLAAVAETAVRVIAPSAENTLSYINAGWNATRGCPGETGYEDAGEELLDNNYTLLRYSVENSGGFAQSGGSMPIGPDKNWSYGITVPADTYIGGSDYSAAGKTLRLHLQWLDLYGNLLPERAPHDFMHPQTQCGYMDTLLGFTRWPGAKAGWTVSVEQGLCISLCFDSQACARQRSAPSLYRRAAAQLNDSAGVRLEVVSPLYPSPVLFQKSDNAALSSWVQAILKSLSGFAPPDPLNLCFALPDTGKLQTITPLTCFVRLSRLGAAAKGFEEVENVLSVISELTLSDDVAGCAASFEAALPALRIFKGRDKLFALRRDLLTLSLPKGKTPSVFAPRPVSNVLRAESGVQLYRYESQKGLSDGETMSYTGVDLNIWLKNALAVLDSAFTPCVAEAVAELEKTACGTFDYDELLNAKKTLAKKLSGQLGPVFAGQGEEGLSEAGKVFYQRLLSRLSNLYDIRAAVCVEAEFSGSLENARLYSVLNLDTTACGVAASPAKIGCTGGKVRFAFTLSGGEPVRSENGDIISSADFSARCRVTHLETGIQQLVDGFESSEWLQAVTGPLCEIEPETFSVPFPLYFFPEIPVMEEQLQLPAQEDSCCTYRFAFSNTVHYPQLQPQIAVQYNLPGKRQRRNCADSLFTSLARFNAVGGAIAADLQMSAQEICTAAELPNPSSSAAITFEAAANSLLKLLQELCEAPFSLKGRKASAQTECISFALSEGTLEGALAVTVNASELPEEAAAQILPEIGAQGYAAVLVAKGKNGFTYVFEDGHKNRLSSAEGQLIKQRTVTLPPKKILVYRNALAELFVEQNRYLVPDRESAPEFVFTTGKVSFSDAVAASAVVSEEKDIRAFLPPDKEDTLTNCLRAMLSCYIEEASQVTLQAECRYRREIGKGLPLIEQPVFMQTPVTIADGDTEELLRGWIAAIIQWRESFPAALRPWLDTEGLRLCITFTDMGSPVLTLQNCLYHGKPNIK